MTTTKKRPKAQRRGNRPGFWPVQVTVHRDDHDKVKALARQLNGVRFAAAAAAK